MRILFTDGAVCRIDLTFAGVLVYTDNTRYRRPHYRLDSDALASDIWQIVESLEDSLWVQLD